MTPLDRLLAEEIPDGSFGGARPLRPSAAHPICRDPQPDPQAADHVADLLAALQPAVAGVVRVVTDNHTSTRKAA